MENVASIVLGFVGLVGLIIGGVLLIVSAAKKRFRKTWKRWTAVTLGGLALLLVGAFLSTPSAQFEVTYCMVEPEEAAIGDTVIITAEIENSGEAEGTYQAVLFIDGERRDEKHASLAPKQRKTISFEVFENTPGIHEVEVGQRTTSFEVLAIPKFEVLSCSVEPIEVAVGESVTVATTVENTGAMEGIYQVELLVDGAAKESKSIALSPGEREIVSFLVSAEAPGIHEVKLGPVTETFLVLDPPQFEVGEININPNPVKVGEETVVSTEIENTGGSEGTYTASLVMDDAVIEKKDITLPSGAAGSLSFELVGEEAGSYVVGIAGQETILEVVEPVRLDTGTFITGDLYGGKAKLTVENGLDLDAVVILSLTEEPDTPLAAVYIQADDSYTIKRIKGGTYILYFCLGKDWDESSKRFITDVTYKRFEDDIKFVSSSSRYSIVTVTLHPVVGGTAATESLSEDEFPEM